MKARVRVLALVPALLLVSTFSSVQASRGQIALDPTSSASVARFLEPLGLDPSDVIVQAGPFNYAGPNCPGTGWNCAPEGVPVLQSARNAGANAFECSGASSGANECTVIQVASGADNVARCVLGTSSSPVTLNPVTQSCAIDQTNTTGLNDALARQAVSQSSLSTTPVVQSAIQNVSIDQDNGAGANVALVDQWVKQKAETKSWSGSISHTQATDQNSSVTQDSGAGNQTLDVIQFQDLVEIAKFNVAGPITQDQNAADDGEEANSFSRQFSDSGVNDTDLTQTLNAYQEGKSSHGNVTQTQGSPSGGLIGDIDGDSGTHNNGSRFDSIQRKNWRQVAQTPGTKVQLQDDLELCCIIGGAGQTYDLCSIEQDAVLDQLPGGIQDIDQRGRAFANENCTLDMYAETDDDTQTTTRSGTSFDVSNECPNTNCEVVDIAPQSAIAMGVRNDSDEETAYDGSTTADPGDTIGYEIGYANTGNGSANVVTITTTVPAGSSLVSCGTCTVDGSTLTWDLGTVEPGTAAVSFQTTLTGPFGEGTTVLSSVATVDTKEEAPITSDPAVTVSVVAAAVSELHKAVRNVRTSEQFTGDETPGSTNAFGNDEIEYKLTYHNHGNADAQNVVVTDPLEGGTFLNCTAGCTFAGNTVTWNVGAVPAGGTVVLTFRIRAPFSLGDFDNTGHVTSASDSDDSNTVNVRVICLGTLCV